MFNNVDTFKFEFNTTNGGIVFFVGETEAEARSYAEMSGFIVNGDGAKVPPAAKVESGLPSYNEWCASMGFEPC